MKQERSNGNADKIDNGTLEPPPGPAPLWVACHTLLAGHEEEFLSCWKKVEAAFQEDDVHDLRVASRRLREGLALFSPCLPAKKSRQLEKQLKKVTTLLGELRNTDEAALFFSALTPEETPHSRNEVGELLAQLKDERERAHKKLRKDLKSLNLNPLQSDLAALPLEQNLFDNAAVDHFMSVALFAAGAIMERARTLAELLPRAVHQADSEAQHQLRIAVKKMRYRLEIIAPLLKRDYQELHGALKGYQEVLGKLHDIDVFRQMLQERIEDRPGRRELLHVMAQRRRRLHATFLEKLKINPLGSIGERVRDAL